MSEGRDGGRVSVVVERRDDSIVPSGGHCLRRRYGERVSKWREWSVTSVASAIMSSTSGHLHVLVSVERAGRGSFVELDGEDDGRDEQTQKGAWDE